MYVVISSLDNLIIFVMHVVKRNWLSVHLQQRAEPVERQAENVQLHRGRRMNNWMQRLQRALHPLRQRRQGGSGACLYEVLLVHMCGQAESCGGGVHVLRHQIITM